MFKEVHTHFAQENPQSARTELISAQNEYAHRCDEIEVQVSTGEGISFKEFKTI